MANDGTVGTRPWGLCRSRSAPVNDAPPTYRRIGHGQPRTAPWTSRLPGSDIDTGDTLGFAVASQPAHGSVTPSGAAAALCWGGADDNGAQSFTFKVNDGTAHPALALVSLTVASVNDAPSAIAGSATVSEDGTVDWTFSGIYLDPGDTLGFAGPS